MKAITAYQEVKQKITRDIVNGRYSGIGRGGSVGDELVILLHC